MSEADPTEDFPPDHGLTGFLDTVSREQVTGWARDLVDPDVPVSLVVSVNGVRVGTVIANAYRKDLEEAGFGTGRHAFMMRLRHPSPVEPCTLRVQREGDGIDLPGSPVVLEPAREFGEALQDGVAALLQDVASDADLDLRARFLARELERLLQLRVDRHGRTVDRMVQRAMRWRWTEEERVQLPMLPRRALVIDDRVPAVDRDAGSHAIVSHMQALQRLGYAVDFAPVEMRGVPGSGDVAMGDLGIVVHRSPWTGTVEEVLRREAGGFELVYVHRLPNMVYTSMLRLHMPKAWIVFALADLTSLRVARQGVIEKRPELAQLAGRLQASEIQAGRLADAVVTHSPLEARLLRTAVAAGKVHVVPWAVPVAPTGTVFGERRGLAFVGGYGHPPNIDAVHYLMLEIMPLVWRKDPSIEVLLVGSEMPDSVRAYAGERVTALGQVPRLADVLARVRLTVAPLTFGAGVKGKVLDSLAGGVPCVCSPVAAEGLALPEPLARLVSATPEAFAMAILRVHDSAGEFRAARDAGLAFVEAGYSEAVVDPALRSALRP